MNENNKVDLTKNVCDCGCHAPARKCHASIGIFLGDIIEAEHHFGEGRDAYCYIRNEYSGHA